MIDDTCDTEWEQMTTEEVEDELIRTYVPEASTMSREDALALALQRDEEFAMEFDENYLDEDGYDLHTDIYDGLALDEEDEDA